MRSLKLTLAYDGAAYVGWQVQNNGIAVQQRLEEAWTEVTQEKIRITASGRTDSGVHAEAQVCSISTNTKIDCATLIRALNAKTPEDISITNVQPAPNGFHAIGDAIGKTYRYQIQYGRIQNALARHTHWFQPYLLDIEAMRAGAGHLVGELDFASFQAVGAERKSTVRNLSRLELITSHKEPFNYLHINISSNGFLYNMVRNVVGVLIRVGRGSEKPDWVREVLLQKDRGHQGQTAPPHALFLVEVDYPPPIP